MLRSNVEKTALALSLALIASACSRAGPRAPDAAAFALGWTPTPMAVVDGGRYRPFFTPDGEPDERDVPTFRIETHPVTNGQFLAFVAARPEWRRSRARRVFVGGTYLAHWAGDLDLGDAPPRAPVTNVSWFAARAYAGWAGRRLPTIDEWELVSVASESAPDGRSEPGFSRRILDWYARPASSSRPSDVRTDSANYWGVVDVHGAIWEWVEDFNSAMAIGDRSTSDLDAARYCGTVAAVDPREYVAFVRFAFRNSLRASYTIKNLGFRCAADEEESR